MTDTKTAVESEAQKAATEQGEVDYVALLAAKEAELEKARVERENYKRGMLKAKGKINNDDDNDSKESMEEIIDRKVKETLLASKEAQLVQEQQEIIKSAALKVKELTLALKNRGQISGAGASSGSDTSDKTVTTETYWSKEQLEALKKRGIDPEKAKELAMRKGGTLPIKN